MFSRSESVIPLRSNAIYWILTFFQPVSVTLYISIQYVQAADTFTSGNEVPSQLSQNAHLICWSICRTHRHGFYRATRTWGLHGPHLDWWYQHVQVCSVNNTILYLGYQWPTWWNGYRNCFCLLVCLVFKDHTRKVILVSHIGSTVPTVGVWDSFIWCTWGNLVVNLVSLSMQPVC